MIRQLQRPTRGKREKGRGKIGVKEKRGYYRITWTSQVALVVKNSPANAEDIRDMGSTLGREDPLEEGTATHSSVLAWRIPKDRGG